MDPLDQEKIEAQLTDEPQGKAFVDSENVEKDVDNRFSFSSLAAVRKKLLDLTGRNQLINYKHPKAGCVRVIDELPDQLYESLLEGHALSFVPVPDPTEKQLIEAGYIEYHAENGLVELKPYPTAEQWANHLGIETAYELPEQASSTPGNGKHEDLDIQTLQYADRLEARLRNLRGKSETAIEESGSNILYLVMGFLEWFERGDSEVKRQAPLFTLPVKLERARLDNKAGVYRYTITLKDEGLLTNVTLREKLANDFNLVLPDIDDESSPEAYFRKIQSTILHHQPRWSLRRMVTLAVLNFSKQVMYQDLDPENWPQNKRIEDHPLVSQFFSSQEHDDGSDATSTYHEEHPIDSIDHVHDHFPLIYDADSSQHSALIDAVNGESLVIEGPPGSGKSQTITNLIAACIANGKRVLFVAEKMAALNVVRDRLDKAGLGDFCLELHSHKTQKARLLEDLQTRLNKQGSYKNPLEIEADIARFEDLKDKLANYVELINGVWKNTSMSLHTILNRAARYRSELQLDPKLLTIDGIDGNNFTLVRQRELLDYADMLINIFNQVQEQAEGGLIENHHWYGVNNTELMGDETEKLCRNLLDWNGSLQDLELTFTDYINSLDLKLDSNQPTSAIEELVAGLSALPPLKGGEPLSAVPELAKDVEGYMSFLAGFTAIHEGFDKLGSVFSLDSLLNHEAPNLVETQVRKLKALGLTGTDTAEQAYRDYKDLKHLIDETVEVDAQLVQISPSLPANLQQACVVSETGMQEFLILLRLINKLPIELWRYRDEVYDSPEMDGLLTKLTNRFKSLVPMHKELAKHFDLSRLPSYKTLCDLRDILESAGLFSLFSSQYRDAKRQLFALATSAKPNKKALLAALPNLADYQKQVEELDQINQEEGYLGDLYKGVETPLDRIVILREWYKSVRDEYGLGFDFRAAMGNQLLTLDKELARALSAVGKNGLEQKALKLVEGVSHLRKRYIQVARLQDKGVNLADDVSPLHELKNSLRLPLRALLPHLADPKIEFERITSCSDQLKVLQGDVVDWNASETKQLLVPHHFALQLAPGQMDGQLLELAHNTMRIVVVAASSKAICSSLDTQPSVEKYEALIKAGPSLREKIKHQYDKSCEFAELGSINLSEWCESSGGRLKELIDRNHRATVNPKWLDTWLDYIRLRKKLTNEGIQNILRMLESGELGNAQIKDVVQLATSHQLALEILRENPVLAEFTGMEQMAIRAKFRDYDLKLMELQREKIAYRASLTRPPAGISSGKVGSYTELSLIKHEAGKKSRHIAIRSLLQRAGKSIQAVKPCFMMSPMSVAQYLLPGQFDFDIVVMDEASQIRPEDALGSIARGSSLVVVGDPKQLPPTSFFDKIVDNENDEDVVALEETESILESAMPMFKTRRLRWHYRSRDESLISFSNLHFYNSDLVLFPSPFQKSQEFGIRFNRVARGRFFKGKNAEEARVIAKAATQHLMNRPDESVGLVAMNAEQRSEIERHVEELVKEDPALRAAFDRNSQSHEPLFIKNLENVQGDERDVIMISLTYGPEEIGGKVYQRFGPINKDVGWRRLNVLFTRSKKRMHIFSSMTSGDILVSPTSKRGVKSLRAFIEYCETGHLHNVEHTGKQPDSDFEIAVMQALAEHGYECEPQLGVTGYYLDLAVRDPAKPGRFLMGIECDGATYHSAKSTRDRDRLRQDILESLGWTIRRIWSTDWFKHPQAQLQPILKELNDLRSKVKTEDFEQTSSVLVTPEDNGEEEVQEDGDFLTQDSVQTIESAADLGSISLSDRLEAFNKTVIEKKHPNTEAKKRLLRPSMIEALVSNLPTSKEEFSEVIPHFLRAGTDSAEGREYLDKVLEIVADYG